MKIQVHNKIKLLPLSQSKIVNIAQWLCKSIEIPVITLDIIFTDDESLRELHEQYLNDSEYTDVMDWAVPDQLEDSKIESMYAGDPDANQFWPIWQIFIDGSNGQLTNDLLN